MTVDERRLSKQVRSAEVLPGEQLGSRTLDWVWTACLNGLACNILSEVAVLNAGLLDFLHEYWPHAEIISVWYGNQLG